MGTIKEKVKVASREKSRLVENRLYRDFV